MDLSAYWVKFFKNAGFGTDVATKHAVIFSNNRIKPDMLPDLDKPSLKEMGITLMGDMIAILRYAKKVVEETTCKKFLVSTESDSTSPTTKTITTKPTIKKIVTKTTTKPPSSNSRLKMESTTKTIKTTSGSSAKPSITVKKKIPPISQTSRLYSDYIDTNQRPKLTSLKRKFGSDDEELGIDGKWVHNETEKRLKLDDDIKYKVIMPKGPTVVKSQKILKKALEQKRTVFHRLGDSMVTSTTNIADSPNSNFAPTFNVTGLGVSKDMKRNSSSSVFNRLGNKDIDRDESSFRPSRNGSILTSSQGILKARASMFGPTKSISTKPVLKKPVGTMRADEEASKKTISHLVRTTKSLKFTDSPVRNTGLVRKVPAAGKLASERIAVPAKSRLGSSKQVTFNKMATVNHARKQGVFSRLGV